MTPRRLLARFAFEGLFRFEALSEAGVDSYRAVVISIGITVFCFHLYLARLLAVKYAYIAGTGNRHLFKSAVASDELFYLSLAFVFIFLVSTLQWQSMFPNEKDFWILAPLPIPRFDIFLARMSALALSLSLFVVTINVPAAVLFPGLAVGPFPTEPMLQRIAAHLVAGSRSVSPNRF